MCGNDDDDDDDDYYYYSGGNQAYLTIQVLSANWCADCWLINWLNNSAVDDDEGMK